MTHQPLSPAAQAVMDAFLADWEDEPRQQDRRCFAAALRALAEQMTPTATPSNDWGIGFNEGVVSVQAGILAIAAELAPSNTPSSD